MGLIGQEVVGWPVVGLSGVVPVKYTCVCGGWVHVTGSGMWPEADVILCVGMLARHTELDRSESNVGTMGQSFHTFGPMRLKIRAKKHLNSVVVALETPRTVRAAVKYDERPGEDCNFGALKSAQLNLTWAAGRPCARATNCMKVSTITIVQIGKLARHAAYLAAPFDSVAALGVCAVATCFPKPHRRNHASEL
jgi:hypothetical protein